MLRSREIRRKRRGELAYLATGAFRGIYRFAPVSLDNIVRALFLDAFCSSDDFGTYWGSIFISTSKARVASGVVGDASCSVSIYAGTSRLSSIPATLEDLPPYESVG